MMAIQTQNGGAKEQPLVYKPDDLVSLLGLARGSVYDGLRRGEIPHIKVGRRILIPRARLEHWLAGEDDGAAREAGP